MSTRANAGPQLARCVAIAAYVWNQQQAVVIKFQYKQVTMIKVTIGMSGLVDRLALSKAGVLCLLQCCAMLCCAPIPAERGAWIIITSGVETGE